MRRVLILVLAIFAIANPAFSQTGSLSPRFSCPAGACPAAPLAPVPVVTISSPVSDINYNATTSTPDFSGTVDYPSPVTVTWTNSRGGSGTAVGSNPWSITNAASASLVFFDDFTNPSNVDATTRPPSTGTGWTEIYNSAGHAITYCRLRASLGALYPFNDANSNLLICLATPNPVLSTANYDLGIKLAAIPGLDDPEGFIFGADPTTNPATWDSHNYCALQWYNYTANPNVVLFKKVNDVITLLGSTTPATNPSHPFTNDLMSLEMRPGGAMTVKQAGVTIIGPVTDSFCATKLGAGVIYGNSRVTTDDVTTLQVMDEFYITNQAGSTTGVTLQTGATNVITVTACDVAHPLICGTDVINITYAVADTQAPSALIDTPTTANTLATSAASQTLGGTGTDNKGVSSVTGTCDNCTGGTATFTATCASCGTSSPSVTWSQVVTLGCSSMGTVNNIVITPHDTAGNTGITDSLVATCTSSDSTAPVITITGPTSSNTYTAPSQSQAISGTATDNVAVTSVLVSCDKCSAVDVVNGLGSWNTVVTLINDTQTITAKAFDLQGNFSTDTITITFSPALSISTVALPAGAQGVTYSQTLTAAGGTGPFSWVNNATGNSSLGGGACTNLSISTAGVISGSPNTLGTCTVVPRVTDSLAATATKSLSIVINSAAADGNSYFNTWIASPYFWKGYSLRPVAGAPISSPYYANQLREFGVGYAQGGASGPFDDNRLWVTYSPSTDTNPHKQDAAKVLIPPFFSLPTTKTVGPTLANAITSSGATTMDILSCNTLFVNADRDAKLDNEIITIVHPLAICNNGGITTINILRGQKGTVATTHSAGIIPYISGNSLANVLRLPISVVGGTIMEEGHTYLFIWDTYHTDSYLNANLDGHKGMTFLNGKSSKWWETRWRYDCGYNDAVRYPNNTVAGCDNVNSDVGVLDSRTYLTTCSGTQCNDWSQTDGITNGANITNQDPTMSQSGNILIKPNRWMRRFVRVQNIANDFDLIDEWAISEDSPLVHIYTGKQSSIPTETNAFTHALASLQVEFNTSTSLCRNRCDRDLVTYVRNVLMMIDPPTDLAAAGFFVAPTP